MADPHQAKLDKAGKILQSDNRKPAVAILEEVLAVDPTHPIAAYYLAWKLDADIIQRYDAAVEARIAELVPVITRGIAKPADDTAKQARAFGLAWGLPARMARATTSDEGRALVAAAKEAAKLADRPITEEALRAAEIGAVWAGDREAGYEKLLAWVKKHPVHGSWTNPHDEEELDSCAGLEPFFEDAGFRAWIAARKPVAGKVPRTAMCAAAGWDASSWNFGVVERPDFGRRGRLLALAWLGGSPLAEAEDHFSEPCGLAYYAALHPGVELVRFVVELGAPIDGHKGRVPLVQIVPWNGLGIEALLMAGANREARGNTGYGKLTALELAEETKMHKARKLLLGGKPAPKPKTTGMDTSGVKAALEKRARTFAKRPWYDDDGSGHFDELFETIASRGHASWEAAAGELESLDPHEMFALALLLAETQPKAATPVKLGAADHNQARIVLGDAQLDGDALLGTNTNWVITGDLLGKHRLAVDEAARIAVAGSVCVKKVEMDGQLWIGRRLDAALSLPERSSGQLVVGGAEAPRSGTRARKTTKAKTKKRS